MYRGPARRTARRASRRAPSRSDTQNWRRMIRRTVLVGGMVLLAASGTSAVTKLSQRDTQQIEEYTGVPSE